MGASSVDAQDGGRPHGAGPGSPGMDGAGARGADLGGVGLGGSDSGGAGAPVRLRDAAADDVSVGDDAAAPVEPEPAVAATVFGEGLEGARRYVALLADDGLRRGLIGPRERGRLWTRHVLNCALAAPAIPPEGRVVDIGSGAGLPGIPLALARPDLRLDLVETLLRRTTFLDEAVALLGLGDRVRVVRARAEDAVATVGGADAVTARAVAPLAKLARWAAPLLRPGGTFLALKGESAAEEVERDGAAARRAGIDELRVEIVRHDGLDEPTRLVIGTKLRGDSAGRGVAEGRRSRRGRTGRDEK